MKEIIQFLKASNALEGYFCEGMSAENYEDFFDSTYDSTSKLWTQHVRAFNRAKALVVAKKPPSVEDVLHLHGVLCRGLVPSAGELRRCAVTVAGQTMPQPKNVAWMLEKVLTASNCDSVRRHYAFEVVHPFEDGNGRLGRLLELVWWAHESGGTIEDAARKCIRPVSHRDTYHRQIQNWRSEKADDFFGKPLILL